MTNVTNVSTVKCDLCAYNWVAVYQESPSRDLRRLQCPNCNNYSSVEFIEYWIPFEEFKCQCGSDLLYSPQQLSTSSHIYTEGDEVRCKDCSFKAVIGIEENKLFLQT